MKPQQADDARDKVLIERNDGGEWTAGLRVAQPKSVLASGVGDDDMASADPGLIGEQRANRAWIDRTSGIETFRGGVQNDRDGGQFRTPNNRV